MDQPALHVSPPRSAAALKARAAELGFFLCTVARAEPMDDEARRLEAWLNMGHHGKMAYLENHFDLRTDPTKLVPGAKSVIMLMHNYFPKPKNKPTPPPQNSPAMPTARTTISF
jgi:epoxyqueuosine reductase